MDGDRTAYALYLVLFLVLVASSLASRRLPIGKTLKMAAAWVAIFALGFAIFSFRSEFTALGSRLKAEAVGTPIQSGEELRIPMADDGHYWVEASINGHEAAFMVDSGASVTTISKEVAAQAGIETGFQVAEVETANGSVIMQRARAERFQVGQIGREEFSVFVNAHDDTNVLGMNFLSSLEGWRVEGNYLVLQP
jgi:aspartyl protease family protein